MVTDLDSHKLISCPVGVLSPMLANYKHWQCRMKGYGRGMEFSAFLTGQVLLAMPGIGDPVFERAVIAICSHNQNGALGIGLGAVVEGLGFHDLLRQFDIDPGDAPNAPVHRGGPVETRRGFVIHSNDWSGQDTVDAAGRWSLTGTIDILRAIASGRGPAHWAVALGYAGWSAGQLEGEMARHGWFNIAADMSLIFEGDAASRWACGFASTGIDPRLLAPVTGTA
jgi:putative transcriptional regulator